MSRDFAIEALLRPPVEFWPAAVALCVAAVALGAPWALMLTPRLGGLLALVLTAFSVRRAIQGYRVVRYQRRMKRLPPFSMRFVEIPVSATRLYLGRGFRWTQIHTQRLADTRRPEAARFVEPGKWYVRARRMERWAERHRIGRPIAWITRQDHRWNPLAPLPSIGGNPRTHAVEPREEDISIDMSERVGHMLIIGSTRVGKTRLAEILICQDIERG